MTNTIIKQKKKNTSYVKKNKKYKKRRNWNDKNIGKHVISDHPYPVTSSPEACVAFMEVMAD